MKISGYLFLVLFCVLSFSTVLADETPSEEKPPISFKVYIQSGMTHNLKNPDNNQNELRVFDGKSDQIQLDLLQVTAMKDPHPGQVGFKLKISGGETAKFIHARGLGEADNSLDLTEGYITYNLPVGQGLKISAGKMITFAGAEYIEAGDNPNYSRSLLFNYAIPFTHTGMRLDYPVSQQFTSTVYIVNGWDNFSDNNTAKTLGVSLGWTPSDQVSMYFNGLRGAEQDNNHQNQRTLFDWVATVKPGEKWMILLNYDCGTEQKTLASGDARWSGFAGVVKYDFSDKVSLSVRGETFNDPQGFRTGTSQTVKEITLTPEIRVDDNLIIRPEYRHDWSDKKVFNGGTSSSQNTLGIGIIYKW